MQNESLIKKLREYGVFNRTEYLSQAFSRNIGLFSREEQEKLSKAKIAIPGMGGVGGGHFITMVRTGICRFHISDFDVYEPANVNRQFGARIPDFGRSKMETMKEEALSINPFIDIKEFPAGISKDNIDDFLEGVDVVLDSLDFFAFDVRRLLFNRAREKGIYVITAGPLGFSSAMLVFAPDKGMGFDEYFNIVDGMKPEEQYLAFALGLAPKATQFKYMDTSKVSFKSKKGPSLYISCQLCCAMAGTEAVRILLGRGEIKAVPYYVQVDPYVRKYYCKKLPMGNRNPFQQIKFKVVKHMLQKNEPILIPPAPDRPAGPVIEDQSGKECIIPSAREFILKAGIQAPSADNGQPWLFSWKGCDLLIESDPDRTHFFYDINQESTLITFGALIENMSLAAGELGLATIPGPVRLSKDGEVSICISFKGGGSQPDILAPFIRHRCINRKPYSSKLIEADLIEAMNSNFQGSSGVRIHWIENQKEKKIFQEIVYLSDRVLFEERRLHEGLFKFIHKGDELFPKDGMNLGVLELSWIQKKIFPFFSKWKYQSLMNKFMVSRAMAFNSVALLKKTPIYAVLTIDQRHPERYVSAGRSMERFWIHASSIGLAVQPMAGFVFLINHYLHNKAGYFKQNHQRMILRIKEQFEKITGHDFETNIPVMFFRLGYSASQKNRTGRRNLSDVMKYKDSMG